MYILIPLGGLGSRFSKYSRPKPFIPVFGKPILYWLLDMFKESQNHAPFKFIIPYHSDLLPFHFESQVKKDYPLFSFLFISLKNNTRGASETLLISFVEMKKRGLEEGSLLSVDGDVFFRNSTHSNTIVNKIVKENTNYVICFEDINKDPIYSYVEVDSNHKITNIVEKEKISNYACCGGYGFSSWKTAMEYCQYIIDNNILQKNEFYISTIIQEMIRKGHSFETIECLSEEYVCLGTPIQLRTFCNNYPISKIKSKRFCFDLDNTLVSYPLIDGDYRTVLPITKNIQYLKYLKKCGNVIIIYTARRMKTHNGNVGKIIQDVGKITLDTLEKFNIPYDELYFGKPEADYYIDDKAISSFQDLEKETGFYFQTIEARDFNTIQSYHSIETIRKSSIQSLKAEIEYYHSLPNICKDLFPFFFEYDSDYYKWYVIEKIKGISISHLYLSQELNSTIFKNIMSAIYRIHTMNHLEEPNTREPIESIEPIQQNPIYNNYAIKIKKRYEMFDYSIYPNSEIIYSKLIEKMEEYEQYQNGKCSMIHGDPVFTNIFLNSFGKIKFIDPRGSLDNIITNQGDIFYDYAKIYQSLLGYDEILLNKSIPSAYKNTFLDLFKTEFCKLYQIDHWNMLQYITASLYFTLIPLHNGVNGEKYMNIIEKILL